MSKPSDVSIFVAKYEESDLRLSLNHFHSWTDTKEISPSNLEEHQHAVNMDDELKRMQQFLRQNGADQEMMEVIEHLALSC